MAYLIPFGQSKGTPIEEAETKDLQGVIRTLSKRLTEDPNKQYADKDRAWIKAAQAEIARRSGQQSLPGDGPRQAPAGQPAQRTAGHAPAAGGALAKRGTDSLAGTFDVGAAGEALRTAAQQMHLVSPATHCGGIPEGCGVAISVVHVDPSTDKDGPGEVYALGGGKLGLSGTTLKKIGTAAAIDWDMTRSGRLDDGSDPRYCHYRAVGVVRNFDGSTRTVSGEVEIDARDGSPQIEEIIAQAEERKREHPDWKNDGGTAQIMQLRKFLLRHAETKAKLRAIADMGVKRSYTAAELKKPFAVARLMWTGQTKDPELKRLFAEKQFDAMVGGARALYGHGPQSAAPALAAPGALHAPPSLGTIAADGELLGEVQDEDDWNTGPTPDPTPTQTQSGVVPSTSERIEGLPSDQDRGDDPDKY